MIVQIASFPPNKSSKLIRNSFLAVAYIQREWGGNVKKPLARAILIWLSPGVSISLQ
jgi:hypothetical protein